MRSKHTPKILLVEDNPRDAELTLRALKKHNLAGQTHWVEDGAEALDYIFRRGQYASEEYGLPLQLVLLDLKLPKVDGLEVLKTVKSDKVACRIPVVVLTSSHEDPDIKAAYALGANSYVVKPVDFDDFMQAMISTGFYWLLINQPPG